jgi:hypothetical protein
MEQDFSFWEKMLQMRISRLHSDQSDEDALKMILTQGVNIEESIFLQAKFLEECFFSSLAILVILEGNSF